MIFEGCKNMIFSGRKITIFRLMRPEKIAEMKKSRKFAFDNYDIKVKCGKQISLRGVEICIDTRPSNQLSL